MQIAALSVSQPSHVVHQLNHSVEDDLAYVRLIPPTGARDTKSMRLQLIVSSIPDCRHWFFSFLALVSLNYVVSVYFLYSIYCREGLTLLVMTALPLFIFAFFMADALFVFTVSIAYLYFIGSCGKG